MLFTSNEVHQGLTLAYDGGTGGGNGSVNITLNTNSVPFVGFMDDVRVYTQVLDEDAVNRLYQSAILTLRLPLDDPPGTSAFAEAGVGRAEAGCVGTCPNAGLPGRIDQAASFDGVRTYLQIAHGPANELTSSFSVAAWIKPDSVDGYGRIVTAANNNSVNGWGFGQHNGNLLFSAYDAQDYVSTGAALEAGKWQHVAAVVDASHGVTFYLNGSQVGATVPGALPVVPDTDDALLVGALTWGATALGHFFRGMIDEVEIFHAALTPAEITRIYHTAPVSHLRLDEPWGATSSADSARFGVNATVQRQHLPGRRRGCQGRARPGRPVHPHGLLPHPARRHRP